MRKYLLITFAIWGVVIFAITPVQADHFAACEPGDLVWDAGGSFDGGPEDDCVGEADCCKGSNNIWNGNGGHDKLFSGPGTDILRGGAESDVLKGQGHADEIYGGGASDVLFDGSCFDCGARDDELYGGGQNDFIHAGDGVDIINGGDGFDTWYKCDFTGTNDVTISIEAIGTSTQC